MHTHRVYPRGPIFEFCAFWLFSPLPTHRCRFQHRNHAALLALPIRLGSWDRFVCGTQLLLPGVHASMRKKSHTRIKYRSPKGPRVLPSAAAPGFNPPTKKSSDRDVAELIDVLESGCYCCWGWSRACNIAWRPEWSSRVAWTRRISLTRPWAIDFRERCST
jgi:hypothetical protein